MKRTIAIAPKIVTEFSFFAGLPPGGLAPTPTDSRSSWEQTFCSDSRVLDEAAAEALLQDSIAYVLSPISSCSEDIWTHAKWSITNEDSWTWRPDQIMEYIKVACLRSSHASSEARTDLECVWSHIISPAISTNKIYIYDEKGNLRSQFVRSPRGLKIPITDFFTAFSWVVTMTESPMLHPTPEKYTRLLCVFSKWCHLLSKPYFRGDSKTPNTAVIFWFKDIIPTKNEVHEEHFSVYTNLSDSDSKAKETARRIRKAHLKDCLGILGPEPKATGPNSVTRKTKFGHCAETLALTSSMRSDHLGYFIKVLAVGINTVKDHGLYLPASERILESTAWKARKKVCENCERLLGRLKKKSGRDGLNYYDWWYALQGEHKTHKAFQTKAINCTKPALKHGIGFVGKITGQGMGPLYSQPTECSDSSDECDTSNSTIRLNASEEEKDNDESSSNCSSESEGADDEYESDDNDTDKPSLTPDANVNDVESHMRSLTLQTEIHSEKDRDRDGCPLEDGSECSSCSLSTFEEETDSDESYQPDTTEDEEESDDLSTFPDEESISDKSFTSEEEYVSAASPPSTSEDEEDTVADQSSTSEDEEDAVTDQLFNSEDEEDTVAPLPSTSEDDEVTVAHQLSKSKDRHERKCSSKLPDVSSAAEKVDDDDEGASEGLSASEDHSDVDERNYASHDPPTSEEEFEESSDRSLRFEDFQRHPGYYCYDLDNSFIVNDGNDGPGSIEELRYICRYLGANYRC